MAVWTKAGTNPRVLSRIAGLRPESLARRVLDAGTGGGLAAGLLAVYESARSGVPLGTCLGLTLPAGALFGGLLGVAVYALDSGQKLTSARYGWLRLWDWNAEQTGDAQAWAAARALLLPWFCLGWLLAGAGAYAWLLSHAESAAQAGAIGASFTGISLLIALYGAESVVSLLAPRLGRLKVLSALGLSLLLSGLAFAALVAWGNTGGDGGVFAIFGVLRRQELDLHLPAAVLWIVGLASLIPIGLARLPGSLSLAALGVILFSGIGLTLTAESALSRTDQAVDVERGTAFAAFSLRRLRAWSDQDRDGFAARFGGGDCDDANDQIFPGAQETPGNGVDEDCSGADAKLRAVASEPASAAVVAPGSMAPIASGATVPGSSATLANGHAAAGAPVVAAAPNQRYNVLFITIDTLRHDLGYMGYSRPISRNIDALAARSVVYENAYALASYTSKSLAPLLIGRYGGETHRGWMHFNKYPAEDKMLQEYAQAAGVKTLSAQGHWYFDEKSGLGRGFDTLDMSAAPKEKQGEGDKTVNSAELTNAAIGLLKSAPAEKPFYLWVHYLDPHAEYVAHEGYTFGKNQRALYDGEVAFTDEHIGRLLAALEQSPFAKNTVVVLTSDHGEAFSEHDMVRHGFELWEELVRVPLIVSIPGAAARRLKVRRSAIDLAPTLLDFLGVPVPAGKLRGISMRSELEQATSEPQARPIFIDMAAGPFNGERQAYIAGDLKLVLSNLKAIGLYALQADPGEKTNLARGPRLAPIMAEFQEFRGGLELVTVRPK